MIDLEPVSKYPNENIQCKQIKKTEEKVQVERWTISQAQQKWSYQQKIQYENRQFQDSKLTKFVFQRRQVLKLTLTLLGVFSIIVSVIWEAVEMDSDKMLKFQSLNTFGMLFLVLWEDFNRIQLIRLQLIRCKKQNIFIRMIRQNILQLLILLIHPNPLMQNWTIQITEPIKDSQIILSINIFLQLIMLTRIYLVYDSLVGSSIYYTTRANRVCRIYTTRNQLVFGMKSVFNSDPLICLFVVFLSLILIYSQMMVLSEHDGHNVLNFSDAAWLVVITMGTLGYGDYIAHTYLARVVAFASAISGIIMASLLILTLSKYLTMSLAENKSHITLRRLALRRVLEDYAHESILQTTRMAGLTASHSHRAIDTLKKKTDKVRLTIRQIKNIVDTEHVNEDISRLFQTISESILQIFKNQKKYANHLIHLYSVEKNTIQQTQFSFTDQIQNIIKDK